VIDGPALPPQQAVGHAATPADVLNCDLSEAMAELCLTNIEDFDSMALGAAVLSHNPAGQTFRGR